MKAAVLIPAAGLGRRMGASISKQYLALHGKPLLAHTLSLFDSHPAVESIYPIVPAEDFTFCQEQIIERFGLRKVRRLVQGGAERQDSVRNGLAALREDGYTEAQRPVLIHDGARPLFNPAQLPALLDVIREVGACILAVPVKDTIKRVAEELIVASPERKFLWQAQTPQGFLYPLLEQAFAEADRAGFCATDDASLLERLGRPVRIVAGDYRNIKVTTPEDLVIATALLDSMEEKSA